MNFGVLPVMKVGNLEIIGTSHISSESVDAVRAYIEAEKPGIVALELDSRRAHSLLHRHKGRLSIGMVRVVGVKGFLFLALASFLQKRLGRLVGMEPGAEMRAALVAAMDAKAKIALIDRDLEVTIRRLSETIGWRERLRFVADIITSPFSNEFGEFRNIDLRKVPDSRLIAKVLVRLKERYPSLYRALIEERNIHMASALADIMEKNPETGILAVVGAGHEKDIAGLVRERLKGVSYSFSFR